MPRPALLVPALCWATFVTTGTGTGIAAFLLDMARDLGTDLAAVGTLVSLLSVAWGIASLVAGAASDRVGRRPVLVAGLAVTGLSRLGLARARHYAAAVAWQLVGGLGGGSFMGTVFAAVSDHVPPERRGRALGWVVTGQSLALVFGVPAVTLVGALAGWRGALTVHGGAALLTALGIWASVPGGTRTRAAPPPGLGAVVRLFDGPVVALLGAGAMERACFAAMAVYLATYLIQSYGVPLAELAGALALVAAGNFVGNVLGGQVADRVRARPLAFAAAAVATALLAVPLLGARPGLAASVVLGFAYSVANALGRPALLAALSEVSAEARGAVLGLNITSASVGWLAATGVGGWLVTRAGFPSLGLFCAATALVGAGLAVASWRSGGGRA